MATLHAAGRMRKRQRVGGQGAGAAQAPARGDGGRRLVDTPRRLFHHPASPQRLMAGSDDSGPGAPAPTAPSPSMLGPGALPCTTALSPRRLRIVDEPGSPCRRTCLRLLKRGLRPHAGAAGDAAAGEAAVGENVDSTATLAEAAETAWPPPPVRGRLAVCGQRKVSRRRLRLAASLPATSHPTGAVIDYAHALRFILRVKSTCAPECFPTFLEILLEYHRGSRTVLQVYEQASALFAEQEGGEDVLAAFQEFLPAP